MQPLTEVVAGNFKQGQILEQTFQMHPGKCYAALAVGAGIQEMDIQFVPLPDKPIRHVLAQDSTKGSNASINCYKYSAPIGVNVKAVYIATAGQGIAAGRVYVR